MHYYLVAPTSIARSDQALFTYHSTDELPVGSVVLLELGHKKVPGVVFRPTTKPKFKTKEVLEIIETKPIPEDLLGLSTWMSEYYATHLATVLQTVLPSGLGKKRRGAYQQPEYPRRNRTNIVLNTEQISALKAIEKASPGTILLRGVTGSGKTRLYIEATKKAFGRGQSAIILVPEIALTAQFLDRFAERFGTRPAEWHSQLSPRKRARTWAAEGRCS
jgi:primosomal protein N' (replication factor Y) (superfamily II helicase)